MKDLSIFVTEGLNKKSLHIENAVLDSFRYDLPVYAGIYFVFVGIPEKRENGFIIQHPRLIYIGEAKNIYERHNDEDGNPIHEHYEDFLKQLKVGEELCYAFAETNDGPYSRKMLESALIFYYKPIINEKSTKGYNHREMEITITSNHEFPYNGTILVKPA